VYRTTGAVEPCHAATDGGTQPTVAHSSTTCEYVHEYRHKARALRFDERPDVGDAKGSEEPLALRRSKPLTLVLYVAAAGSRWASASSAVCHYIASVRDFPANPRDRVYEPYGIQIDGSLPSRHRTSSARRRHVHAADRVIRAPDDRGVSHAACRSVPHTACRLVERRGENCRSATTHLLRTPAVRPP
jgi:hypothetical protein